MTANQLKNLTYHVKVAAVMNHKGGVGKTTESTFIMEFGVIHLGLRILGVEFDPQLNLSNAYIRTEDVLLPGSTATSKEPPIIAEWTEEDAAEMNQRSSSADMFEGKAVYPYPSRLLKGTTPSGFDAPIEGNLEILCGSHSKLKQVINKYGDENGRIETMVVHRAYEFLQDPALNDEYDLIVIDTGPMQTALFRAAIRAATDIIVPIELEQKAVDGIAGMLGAIASEHISRRSSTKVNFVGLAPNKVQPTTVLHKQMLEVISDAYGKYLFPDDAHIPQSIRIPECDTAAEKPLSIFGRKEKNCDVARRAAERFAIEAYRRIFKGDTKMLARIDKAAKGLGHGY